MWKFHRSDEPEGGGDTENLWLGLMQGLKAAQTLGAMSHCTAPLEGFSRRASRATSMGGTILLLNAPHSRFLLLLNLSYKKLPKSQNCACPGQKLSLLPSDTKVFLWRATIVHVSWFFEQQHIWDLLLLSNVILKLNLPTSLWSHHLKSTEKRLTIMNGQICGSCQLMSKTLTEYTKNQIPHLLW